MGLGGGIGGAHGVDVLDVVYRSRSLSWAIYLTRLTALGATVAADLMTTTNAADP